MARAVADWPHGLATTTLYLDAEGSQYPRRSDLDPRVGHLFRLARQRAEELGGDVPAQVARDLTRIAGWLGEDFERGAVRGLAFFSRAGEGLFEPVTLPLPVYDQVVVEPEPDVAQLCAVLAACRPVVVAAVDGRHGRLLRLDAGDVEELDLEEDGPPRQVDTDLELGSFDRHEEELGREHYRAVAQVLVHELERRPVTHLVLDGPPEAVVELEQFLPPLIRSQVAGRMALPMRSGSTELAAAASEAVGGTERARRASLLHDFRERAHTRTGVAVGLEATLDALAEKQAGMLVVERGFEAAGGRCTRCGRLVPGGGPCPNCGAATGTLDNVVGSAVADAVRHDLPLEFVVAGDLEDLGRIGAFVPRRGATASWRSDHA